MTKEQEDWIRTRRIIAAIKPKEKIIKPTNWLGAICFTISNSSYFEASMVTTSYHQYLFLYYDN